MNGHQLEDAEIARLIHDVADGWTMPPVRLDAPTWRERVRGPRAHRVDAARSWLARLGRAATAAVALTVAATLIAVVITLPADPGKSAEPSDESTPRATDASRPSPLPKLVLHGDPPSPSEIVLQTEEGDVAVVNLADGSIGRPLTGARFGSELQVRADGTLLCLCLSESGSVAGRATTASVTLVHLEAGGRVISSREIASFDGAPDPRDEGRTLPDEPRHVLTAMGFSEGGAFGFVGWSTRAHPAWNSGVLVVELTSGEIVSSSNLSDVTTGDDNSRRVLSAPAVVGQDGDALVIGRAWYEFTPPDSDSASYTFDVEAFRASFTGGILGDIAAVPGTAGCGDTIRSGGLLSDGGTWLACSRGAAFETTVRRVAGDGEILPDVTVRGADGIDGDVTALARDGSALFVWNPDAATLTRIDLASGEQTTGEGVLARLDSGPLAAVGRWLAPAAAAKSILRSSVVVSPDGSRVYAIGVQAGLETPEVAGSAGVFVFDASTLDLIETYAPTADFVSLAIGVDGRFLYAAGMPGVDAFGRRRIDQGASITVFDTADGTPRLIAGQLGTGLLTFGPEPLR